MSDPTHPDAIRVRDAKIVFCGLSGSGKTTACKAFPGRRPYGFEEKKTAEVERLNLVNAQVDAKHALTEALSNNCGDVGAIVAGRFCQMTKQNLGAHPQPADAGPEAMDAWAASLKAHEEKICRAGAEAYLSELLPGLCQVVAARSVDAHEPHAGNIESVDLNHITLHLYDCSGDHYTWESQLHGVKGLIYVVDCSDAGTIQRSMQLLSDVVLTTIDPVVPVVILANKSDRKNALSADEIESEVYERNSDALATRVWTVIASMATKENDEGICDAQTWLVPRLPLLQGECPD